VLILFQTSQWQSTATEIHTPFAQRRYLLVLLAGACGCVACLLDSIAALLRMRYFPLIIIDETEARPSLPPRTHGQCQRQPPFARGHIAITKNLFSRVRETKRDDGGVCSRAGQGRARGAGEI
jgi:hypothetical protein